MKVKLITKKLHLNPCRWELHSEREVEATITPKRIKVENSGLGVLTFDRSTGAQIGSYRSSWYCYYVSEIPQEQVT